MFRTGWRTKWRTGYRTQIAGGMFGGGPMFNGHPLSFYSLLDTFSDTRAAGSVNGTLPDVGGARVVTDTNSKLSVGAGVASFATGGVGAGDPGLWYPSQVRLLGKVMLGTILPGVVVANAQIGFDTGQSANLIDAFRFITGPALQVLTAGIGLLVNSFYSQSTFICALVMRTTGMYFFIKGSAAYVNWTLIWINSLGSSAMFPAVVCDISTPNFISDNIRVPVALFIPTPIAFDSFTRADGALGSSETTGPDAQTTPALAWTGTTYTISTNKAINTPTLGADVVVNGAFAADTNWNKGAGWTIAAGTAVATAASSDITAAAAPLAVNTWYQTAFTQGGFGGGTVNVKLGTTAFPTHATNATFTETGLALTTALAITGVGLTDTIDNFSCLPLTLSNLLASPAALATADVMVDVNCTLVSATDGKQLGLVTNLDSANAPLNFRQAYLDGKANCIVVDWAAGVPTVKQTTAITYSASATLRVVSSGTTFTVFYNNALVGAAQTMAGNTNKIVAMFNTSPLNSLDNFQVFGVGTSGEYAGLNAL